MKPAKFTECPECKYTNVWRGRKAFPFKKGIKTCSRCGYSGKFNVIELDMFKYKILPWSLAGVMVVVFLIVISIVFGSL